ncbi:DUF5626 family protein [Lapidilactobacillus bayanensis]|uniref:DUF5626 family protein n=1 Tax=Lapidilactobacillus bayanensis TaxID=2485998 RepID=UPI000F7A6EA1|nr:DUF5626 family protein [Lapidilactobacillus bayanensis]
MKKIISILVIGLAFICVSTKTTFAEVDDENQPALNYDLAIGGTQTLTKTDTEGNSVEITVSEDQNILRMANKTYTVSKKGAGWHVSYKVGVKSNKITTVSGLNAVATIGSFKSSSLKKNSAMKATWAAIYNLAFTTSGVSCITTISSGSLHVS